MTPTPYSQHPLLGVPMEGPVTLRFVMDFSAARGSLSPTSPLRLSSSASRIISNANRMRIPAHACALGLDLCAGVAGHKWIPVCVWCLEKVEIAHDLRETPCARVHGDCSSCRVSGRDVLVALLPESLA